MQNSKSGSHRFSASSTNSYYYTIWKTRNHQGKMKPESIANRLFVSFYVHLTSTFVRLFRMFVVLQLSFLTAELCVNCNVAESRAHHRKNYTNATDYRINRKDKVVCYSTYDASNPAKDELLSLATELPLDDIST